MKKAMKKKMTEERQREWFKAARNNDTKTIQKMIEEGFDVNAHGGNGWTALHYASHWGKADIAKLLIDNGADVNAKDNVGWTPLHFVCDWEYIEKAKFLIDNGADVTVRDKDGDTPIGYLMVNNPQKYEELMQWLSEYHPEKALELMASESVQGKGVGL